MTTMKAGGVINSKINGTKAKESFHVLVSRKNQVVYLYHDVDGKIFSCMKPTLEECRDSRDEWMAKKDLYMPGLVKNLITGLN